MFVPQPPPPHAESRMSLQSINGAQEFADDHYNGEPEMNAESEYCRFYLFLRAWCFLIEQFKLHVFAK